MCTPVLVILSCNGGGCSLRPIENTVCVGVWWCVCAQYGPTSYSLADGCLLDCLLFLVQSKVQRSVQEPVSDRRWASLVPQSPCKIKKKSLILCSGTETCHVLPTVYYRCRDTGCLRFHLSGGASNMLPLGS